MSQVVFITQEVNHLIHFTCECGRQISNTNLQSSYFCNSCQSIKCLMCIKQNLDSAFCPQCLDVTKITSSLRLSSNTLSSSLYFSQSSLHTLRHRCRKCIYCPICNSSSIFLKNNANNSAVYFYCPFCRWNSLDESIKEENITKLYSIPIKLEKEDPTYQIVERIIKNRKQEHENSLTNNMKDDKSESNRDPLLSKNKSNIELDNFELDEQEFHYTPLSNKLSDFTTYTSENSALSIQRIPLLGSKTINCRKCNKDLVSYKNIESDVGSSNNINFNKRESATLYIPHISLAIPKNQIPDKVLQINEWNEIYLRFLNPGNLSIEVHLLLNKDKNQENFELYSDEYKFNLSGYPLPHIYDPIDSKPLVILEKDDVVHQNGASYLKLKIKPQSNTSIIVYFYMIMKWSSEDSNESNTLKTTIALDISSMYKS